MNPKEFHDRVISDEISTEEALEYIRDPKNTSSIVLYFPYREAVKIPNPDILLAFTYLNEGLKGEETWFDLDNLLRMIYNMPDKRDFLLLLGAIDLYGDDLEELRLKALNFLTQGNSLCKVYLTKDYPLYEVLLKGFVPINIDYVTSLWMEHPNCPLENFHYMGHSLMKNLQIRGFKMFTEQHAKSLANPDESTAFLKYTYPHLLYSSNRLKTDMSMYRVPFSNNSLDGYNKLQLIEGETTGSYYLPVTRYSESPETGLYHNIYKPGKCGTFSCFADAGCFTQQPASTTSQEVQHS